MPHNGINILRRRWSGSSVVERVYLIGEKTKSYAQIYLKTIGESINLAFYAWIVIQYIIVKVTKFRSIQF